MANSRIVDADCHILEPPGATQIAKEMVSAIARDVEVRVAIIVVVADRDPLTIAGILEAGPGGDISEVRKAAAAASYDQDSDDA